MYAVVAVTTAGGVELEGAVAAVGGAGLAADS